MPEVLRSLIVILVIAAAVFVIAKRSSLLLIKDEAVLKRRIFSWYFVTLAAFIAGNFWLFAAIATAVLYINGRKDQNPVAFVFFVLFAVPLFPNAIPGFGIVNYFFDLNYFRIISLAVFFPRYLDSLKTKGGMTFGSVGADKFVAAYILYSLALLMIASSLTNVARQAFVYFIDIFLPYYVVSRHLKKKEDFDEAIKSFVIAVCIVSMVGIFEYLKGWLVYQAVPGALGVAWDGGGYLLREGKVRALASSGQAIVLGYIIAVAIGFNAYLGQQASSLRDKVLVTAVLLAGIFSPLSRGPWVQAALTGIILVVLSPKPYANLFIFMAFGVFLVIASQFTPYAESIISYMPFVGTVDASNVEFRKNLLENAVIVIRENLWFGSPNYMQTEEMESMRSGGDGGIIDIVNSYIAVALSGGLVGLVLFAGYFVSIGKVLFDAYRTSGRASDQFHALVRSMIALFSGIVVVIYTVSSITFIPIIYWMLGGMAVALRDAVSSNYLERIDS